MTLTRDRIEGLVMSMQGAFLRDPSLDLTLDDAQKYFSLDRTTCRAVLDVLVDASVLERSARGGYARHFPGRSRFWRSGVGAVPEPALVRG